MKNLSAKALISKAVSYFDISSGCKVDFTTEGKDSVYRDALGNLVQPLPTELGHNRYDIHGPNDSFRQEIYFQNGSPTQNGVNGLSNEAVIATVLHRISKQNESYPSAYNVLTIYLLEAALAALHARVKDRTEFGIYDTDKVEPEQEDQALLSKALSIINSLGILGDLLIKFDSAYALASPGRIAQYVEVLAKHSKSNPNEISLASAFSLSTTAIMGSGIFRGFASIGSEMLKVMQGAEDDAKDSQDNTTNDPA